MTAESLTRLRRANPVTQAPTIDAPELFAQITSLPVDPRLARSPRPRSQPDGGSLNRSRSWAAR